MRKIFVLFVLLWTTVYVTSRTVQTGLEVLRSNNYRQLEGKRIGLITNPTGIDRSFQSTIDILHNAPNVKLVALYGPEHGVRGDVYAGDKVDNRVDVRTTGIFALRSHPKTHKGDAAGNRCPGIRHTGQRMSFVYLHFHHGAGDGSSS